VGLGNDNAPVRFAGGQAVKLPLGSAATGNALAINDAHVVAGLLGNYQDYGNSRAAVWDNDVLTDLNALLPAGSGWRRLSRAEGINNAGVIIGVGLRESQPQTQTGFVFDRAGGTIAEIPRPPQAAANTPFLPKAINDAGHVVGEMYVGEGGNSRMRGFLYRDGACTDLGVLAGDLGSTAKGINRTDEVIGNTVSPSPIPGRGFLWKDGDMIDLNELIPADSPWTIDAAIDINDAGDIIARASLPGQGWRLVLLRKE
jgi:probable HAF family extracellular repeat protein